VIEFIGNQRNGGVPAFRNQSVMPEGPSSYRIVEEELRTDALSVRSVGGGANAGARSEADRVARSQWAQTPTVPQARAAHRAVCSRLSIPPAPHPGAT
jgi:hypothetical protein